MKKILFFIPITVACLQLHYHANAQSTIPGNASTAFPEWLGWNAGFVKHLDIVNGHPAGNNINFFTNAGAGPAWANQRMTILGATGFIGMDHGVGGYFTIPPAWELDVRDDINIYSLASAPNATFNSGYRINGNLVLYLPGDVLVGGGLRNTFVGRGGNINVNPLLPGCYC